MRPPAPPELRLPASPRPRSGFWVSLTLHVLLVGLALAVAGRLPRTPQAALLALSPGSTGGGGSGDGGAGREREVRYISLPARGAEPVAPRPHHPRAVAHRPVPEPAIPAPPPAPQPIDTAAIPVPPESPVGPPSGPEAGAVGPAAGTGAGAGAGLGTGTGPGTGAGQGAGPGVGAGGPGGRGAGLSAPEPRQLVLPPPDYPKELKGRQVEVTFFVAADGRVERISVAPPLPDGGFARRFEEAMRSYRFRPARSPAGAPVPGSTRITVLF